MNLPLHIARRYLFARKSHNVINLISAISAAGMAIGTAALILILSVYNGFDALIKDNLSDVDPDYLLSPSSGKAFVPDGEAFEWLRSRPEVESLCGVIQEEVFLSYEGTQSTAIAKGVDSVYEAASKIDRHLVDGHWSLHKGEIPMAAMGAELAAKLGVSPRFLAPVTLYYPDREGSISLSNPMASLRSEDVYTGCLTGIGHEQDSRMVVVPIEVMQSLLNYDRQLSGMEIRLRDGLSGRARKGFAREARKHLGEGFTLLDKYNQHPALYKLLRYEKAAIFIILIFVVIIVAFNIFGSLQMLMIEKREDIGTLSALGAGDGTIKRIFVLEGWMISLLGMAVGLVAGIVLALLQQHFGLVKIPGNYIVDAYPVVLKAGDVLLTAAAVAAVGFVVALAPVAGRELKTEK